MSNIRTRFAPSPTGFMHIGNLRTALFSYLYAKSNNGKFILRIEDTDQGRYVSGAVDVIYKTLNNSGIKYDEGPDIGGNFGPYIQSERVKKGIYLDYAKQLIDKGFAYYCFCDKSSDTDFDVEDHFGYDRKCRCIPKEEAQNRVNNGEPYVIRQAMPIAGTTKYHDLVYGDVEVSNEELDDQVLIKRDGMPTYNFANVIDDHLMGITDILRGSEYIVSTPKYKLLYEDFEWDVPNFIHLPLIMGKNDDGTVSKLSKRHGATSFEQLIEKGYLPQAIINYIALLGWSPKSNDEIFSLEELEKSFSVDGISHSPSVFDYQKLDWINSYYISSMDEIEFYKQSLNFVSDLPSTIRSNWGLVCSLLKTRISNFSEINDKIDFLINEKDYDLSLFVNKKNKTDYNNSFEIISEFINILNNIQDKNWTSQYIYDISKNYAEENGYKIGHIMWPLRIAVSGLAVTPGGATDIMEIIGKDETIKRLKNAINRLANLM